MNLLKDYCCYYERLAMATATTKNSTCSVAYTVCTYSEICTGIKKPFFRYYLRINSYLFAFSFALKYTGIPKIWKKQTKIEWPFYEYNVNFNKCRRWMWPTNRITTTWCNAQSKEKQMVKINRFSCSLSLCPAICLIFTRHVSLSNVHAFNRPA